MVKKLKEPPSLLFVTRVRESKIRAYRYVQRLSNGKFLYEDIDNGFKECFLRIDLMRNQLGYVNNTYKAQEMNKKVRERYRKKKETNNGN